MATWLTLSTRGGLVDSLVYPAKDEGGFSSSQFEGMTDKGAGQLTQYLQEGTLAMNYYDLSKWEFSEFLKRHL